MREPPKGRTSRGALPNLNDSERVARVAARLFIESMNHLVELSRATVSGERRLFFPNGIELIRFTFKLGPAAEISFTIAGGKAPQEPADAEQVSGTADSA